jgi:hypothetical protein
MSTPKKRRKIMFEGHADADQRMQHVSVIGTPCIKKYVRATVAEADLQGNIRTHEGVVTRDFGEQMEVVNPQPIWTGFAPSPWPKYVMKRCHKEGAEEIPVPLGKVKVVEEIREMLDAQV